MSDELILPPGPVMVPIGIVFDHNMQPVVRDTYIQLLALAGENMRIATASWQQFIKMTNKSRSVLYGHLCQLKQDGLIAYTASSGTLWVEFLSQLDDCDPSSISSGISENIPISGRRARIRENGHTTIKRLKDSTKGPKDLPSSSTSINYVSESGFMHGSAPLSDEIRASLKSIGVWNHMLDTVALLMQKDGWTDKQVMATVEELKLKPGKNNLPGILMWRLTNNAKPKQKVRAGHELDHILEDAPIFAEDKRGLIYGELDHILEDGSIFAEDKR